MIAKMHRIRQGAERSELEHFEIVVVWITKHDDRAGWTGGRRDERKGMVEEPDQ
jgi:hypothetical protein